MKKIISFFLVVLMIVTVFPFPVFAENTSGVLDSGICGVNDDNLTWTLYNDGELVISGTGAMCNWSMVSSYPWYSYRSSVKSVVIKKGVTTIGHGAFYNCTSLESVIIGNSVTTIGDSAFYNCTSLESVTIGNSVTEIGDYAFYDCESLESVTVPDSVTTIGARAFYNCTSIESVTIGNSVTSIGYSAFYNCTSLGSVTIGNSVTSISDFAFSGCTSLGSVTIPDSVTTIGDCVFGNCTSLESVTIGNSATTIGDHAFSDCTSLKSVIIPDSVTRIGDSAFDNCTSLEGVSIGNSVTTIGKATFYNCTSLKSVIITDSVTRIGDYAFDNCTSLESVTIGNSVTEIGDYAFYDCESLEGITIPDSVTKIGDYAFGHCTSLKSVTISDNVTKIGDYAFGHCTSLESVTIPDSVTTIGYYVFEYCKSLESVTIGNSVTTIGDHAFYDCESLERITIPVSVTKIGYYAFLLCISLETVYYTGTESQWSEISIGSNNDSLTNATIIFNSNGTGIESNQSIAILTTEKSLCVAVGDTFNLGFAIMNNTTGLLESEWKKMAVVISDPSIISLSEYETEEYGYSIDVTGKKIGSTNVTVTDTESGISTSFVVTVKEKYNKSYSYDIENISTFYPSNKWESDIPTNIYDLNGLYVNNYKCEKKGDKYYISMDVYNQRYHTAAIDIYNENGEWVDCEPIEKFSDISSISDTIEQIYYLIADPITGKWLTYEQSTSSKHTSIKDIEVPEGGYFTISNNYLESPGTFLFNASEILFNGTCTLIHLITDDEIKFWEFSGLLKESVVKNKDIRKDFYEMFIEAAEKEITDYTKNILEGNIDNACAGLSGLLENMLSSLKIEWKHLFNSVMGVGQSIFTYFSGAAGIALKGCFEITDLSSQLLQARHLAVSSKASYVTVYSEIAEGFINPHGLIINTNGNIDAESVLQVFKIFDEDIINTIPGNSLSNYELYNICFVKNDELVQPNGKVKVQIPIPLGFDSDSCKIYRQESNGSWTELMSHVEGNYLVFETDHFSLYAISGVSAELSVYSLPEKIAYKSGEILSTDGLVLEINGELITSGYICNPAVISGCGTQTVTVTYGQTQTTFNVMSHTPGEWEVVTPAQVGVEGKEQQKCTVCGEVLDERVIPALPDVSYMTGDANGDGKITAADARIALRISAKVDSLETYNLTVAVLDVTGDGKLTAADARKILRIAAKIE